jgi:hypothetical protein
MSEERFDGERLYQATMALARSLRERGIITADELMAIDAMMLEKYRPPLGGLCPENTLKQLDFTAF